MSNDNKRDFSQKPKSSLDEKIEAMKGMSSRSSEEAVTEKLKQSDIKDLLNEASSHVTKVKSQVLTYTGKVGYNPFVWLRVNNFSLAEEILKSPDRFDESTIRTILTRVINTSAEPPVAVNPNIPSVKQILKNQF